MYAEYTFNKEECKGIKRIIEKAKNIWIKDLPPLFQGILIGEFEEIVKKMFDGESEVGKIDYELAIQDVIIPAVETACNNLENKNLKELLSKFVCDFDNSTLYDVLKSRIAEKQRNEQLKKSYETREAAIADGIENPFEYHCWECGRVFWAEWRSKYHPPAVCPVCDVDTRG